MSKVNIYVNSKNRKSDETPSNFSVIIPDGLLRVNKDEYFTLSVNSFYCYNDFYQCNINSNYFTLIFEGLSNDCASFHLQEFAGPNETNLFETAVIERNKTDVYEVEVVC